MLELTDVVLPDFHVLGCELSPIPLSARHDLSVAEPQVSIPGSFLRNRFTFRRR